MIQHIVLLLETFLMRYCFHVFNERKIRSDIGTILFVLGNVLFWETINFFQINRMIGNIVYIAYYIFDVRYFKNSWKKAIVDLVASIVCITICQIIGIGLGIAMGNVLGFSKNILMLIEIIIACIVAVLVLPSLKLGYFYIALKKYLPYVGTIILLLFIEVSLILIQSRYQQKIQMEIYTFTIPILLGMIGIVVKLIQKDDEAEEIKKELKLTNAMHFRYEKLLDTVRERQHGFNNQITAILGTHYVYKSYEELVKNQQELCNIVMNDNKFNKLLWLRNDILAGFLFQKLKEIEGAGVNVHFDVFVTEFTPDIPAQYFIEMIGILLDNAYEATMEMKVERIINIQFADDDVLLILSILNPSPYIEYSDISKMFVKGVSSKGQGRGIGLARVAEICEKYDCDVLCENVDEKNMNWIKFSIIVKKAEN